MGLVGLGGLGWVFLVEARGLIWVSRVGWFGLGRVDWVGQSRWVRFGGLGWFGLGGWVRFWFGFFELGGLVVFNCI